MVKRNRREAERVPAVVGEGALHGKLLGVFGHYAVCGYRCHCSHCYRAFVSSSLYCSMRCSILWYNESFV